jgi:DNA-binding XRE family transcriptional regulator
MVFRSPFKGAKGVDHKEFSLFRQSLQKTQKQMANLLGTSLRAVQSFEQGWRKVPVHIERQLLFLLSAKQMIQGKSRPCWDIRNCPSENRGSCPAWEFNMGWLCWFINGTVCQGKVQGSWAKKMKVCQNCEVFVQAVNPRDIGPAGQAHIRRGRKSERERNG